MRALFSGFCMVSYTSRSGYSSTYLVSPGQRGDFFQYIKNGILSWKLLSAWISFGLLSLPPEIKCSLSTSKVELRTPPYRKFSNDTSDGTSKCNMFTTSSKVQDCLSVESVYNVWEMIGRWQCQISAPALTLPHRSSQCENQVAPWPLNGNTTCLAGVDDSWCVVIVTLVWVGDWFHGIQNMSSQVEQSSVRNWVNSTLRKPLESISVMMFSGICVTFSWITTSGSDCNIIFKNIRRNGMVRPWRPFPCPNRE